MLVLTANSLAVEAPGLTGERALEYLVHPRGFRTLWCGTIARHVAALLHFQCALITFRWKVTCLSLLVRKLININFFVSHAAANNENLANHLKNLGILMIISHLN